jgi:outer membrane immunogenic protein
MRKVNWLIPFSFLWLIAEIAPASAQAAAPPIWQGLYLGIGGGGQSFNGGVHSLTTSTTTHLSGHAAQAGLYGGYNWTSGPWLYGVEVDWGHTFARSNQFNMFSARGRVGYVINTVLLYGTAGIATENRFLTETEFNALSTQSLTSEARHTGFVGGGGIEAMIASNLSLRAEGLFFHGGNAQYNFAFAAPLPPNTANRDFNQVIYRAGLTYHFR